MKGIDHLVLAGHDLDAMRDLYAWLGFTMTPRAQHPFGTGNTAIQLHGSYLELLSVTKPEDVIEPGPGEFSFSAFNRDYLARHEGFSMLVLGTSDASAAIETWREAGFQTYAPFDFSRLATFPGGEEKRIGFSLAYTSTPGAPWFGHFACQHHAPEYFAQPQFLTHANTAHAIRDVWITGEGALGLVDHMRVFVGAEGIAEAPGRYVFDTQRGRIVLSTAENFRQAFGGEPPNPSDGPHLGGFTIDCASLNSFTDKGLAIVGERLVLPSDRAFGTAVGFTKQR
ncbi:VOC family protein [Mesorhizobium sp. VNQ89]|uniref:VOC family protein n=1 Tax=Mesorhizobium quangtriensis TaxID=3157709 RepID=UPI0032B7AF49